MYNKLENGEQVAKGKLKENLENNKDLALLSRELGRIDVDAPIDKNLDDFQVQEWDNSEVLSIFRELRFNRYIERFDLENKSSDSAKNDSIDLKELFDLKVLYDEKQVEELKGKIIKAKEMHYYINKKPTNDPRYIINKCFDNIYVYFENEKIHTNFWRTDSA